MSVLCSLVIVSPFSQLWICVVRKKGHRGIKKAPKHPVATPTANSVRCSCKYPSHPPAGTCRQAPSRRCKRKTLCSSTEAAGVWLMKGHYFLQHEVGTGCKASLLHFRQQFSPMSYTISQRQLISNVLNPSASHSFHLKGQCSLALQISTYYYIYLDILNTVNNSHLYIETFLTIVPLEMTNLFYLEVQEPVLSFYVLQ